MPPLKGDDGSASGITPPAPFGVWGDSDSGDGVAGTSRSGDGVYGQSGKATGVHGVGGRSSTLKPSGVVGVHSPSTGFGVGTVGATLSSDPGAVGVGGIAANGTGVLGISNTAHG